MCATKHGAITGDYLHKDQILTRWRYILVNGFSCYHTLELNPSTRASRRVESTPFNKVVVVSCFPPCATCVVVFLALVSFAHEILPS